MPTTNDAAEAARDFLASIGYVKRPPMDRTTRARLAQQIVNKDDSELGERGSSLEGGRTVCGPRSPHRKPNVPITLSDTFSTWVSEKR